jgi:hypothetical protein
MPEKCEHCGREPREHTFSWLTSRPGDTGRPDEDGPKWGIYPPLGRTGARAPGRGHLHGVLGEGLEVQGRIRRGEEAMIAFEIIMLFGISFALGYVVGKSGRTDSDKARQEMEDQAIEMGLGEVAVKDGKRVFRFKKAS